jgi:hypothetical protein
MGSLELRIFPAFQLGNTVCANLHPAVPPDIAVACARDPLLQAVLILGPIGGVRRMRRRTSPRKLRRAALARDSTPSSRIKID